ncbi:MAG: SidA/IucD/PvdA family monooxygenase, partial [Rhodospirillaceae bacterium]|nr:SidA/IucD/PvdA family monooxygenase [Rhodospirillaceae bacterium]
RDLPASDPEAIAPDGALSPRRSLFGDYMVGEVRAHMAKNPSASQLRHVQDRAAAIAGDAAGYRVSLMGGGEVAADFVVLCTSHGQPALPPGFDADLARHDGLVLDPWAEAKLSNIGTRDRILVVGAGLTGADVVTSLRHHGHRGGVTMISRHGLPSNRQHDFGDINILLERVRRPVPDLIARHGEFNSVAQVVRAVRQDVSAAKRKADNADWREAFDHVRDAAGAIWRGLPTVEKLRYSRHLSSYYGSHRNRVAPQVVDKLDEMRRAGQLSVLAGQIESARADGAAIAVAFHERHGGKSHLQTFDAVIICTGPIHRPDATGNAFLQDVVHKGFARSDAYGLGMDVDNVGRAIGANDLPSKGLYVVGPLTRGYFGDVIGVPQITAQLHTILPALLGELAGTEAHN